MFPYPCRDGGEGGEEAVYMPTGVTYVTEKHEERLSSRKNAFFPRERDFDPPDTVYHQRGGWQGRR